MPLQLGRLPAGWQRPVRKTRRPGSSEAWLLSAEVLLLHNEMLAAMYAAKASGAAARPSGRLGAERLVQADEEWRHAAQPDAVENGVHKRGRPRWLQEVPGRRTVQPGHTVTFLADYWYGMDEEVTYLVNFRLLEMEYIGQRCARLIQAMPTGPQNAHYLQRLFTMKDVVARQGCAIAISARLLPTNRYGLKADELHELYAGDAFEYSLAFVKAIKLVQTESWTVSCQLNISEGTCIIVVMDNTHSGAMQRSLTPCLPVTR